MVFRKIEGFLRRLSPALNSKKSEELVSEVIKKELPMDQFELKVKGKNVFIFSSSSILQNEIFLKKEKILERLKKELGPNSPKEISFRKL